jgi:hypothetical protein
MLLLELLLLDAGWQYSAAAKGLLLEVELALLLLVSSATRLRSLVTSFKVTIRLFCGAMMVTDCISLSIVDSQVGIEGFWMMIFRFGVQYSGEAKPSAGSSERKEVWSR